MLEFLPPYLLLYLGVGVGAGLLAGLFGVGGGLIIVPALVIAFTAQGIDPAIIMHLALGTSLATICATAISSVLAHHRRGAVDWLLLIKLLPGIAAGAVAGAAIADYTSRSVLQFIFGIGATLIAIWMLFGGAPTGITSNDVFLMKTDAFGTVTWIQFYIGTNVFVYGTLFWFSN